MSGEGPWVEEDTCQGKEPTPCILLPMSYGYAYGPTFCAVLAWAWLDLRMGTGSIGKQSQWEDSRGFMQIHDLPLPVSTLYKHSSVQDGQLVTKSRELKQVYQGT